MRRAPQTWQFEFHGGDNSRFVINSFSDILLFNFLEKYCCKLKIMHASFENKIGKGNYLLNFQEAPIKNEKCKLHRHNCVKLFIDIKTSFIIL